MKKKRNGLVRDKQNNQYWYKDGLLHHETAPAVIYADGKRFWYQNGLKHRENGPAVEFWHGANQWYLNGQELTKEEVMSRWNAKCEKEQLEETINPTNKKNKIKL
jgi:hypothetical protein